MAFIRDTKLFLWKNGLQKARNAGTTSCECLTPIILVALFALLYKATNVTFTPDSTFECDFRSNTGAKFDFLYLPRALNTSVLKLALVGDDSVVNAFASHLALYYPGIWDPSVLSSQGLNCTGLALDVQAQNGMSLPYFPGFSKGPGSSDPGLVPNPLVPGGYQSQYILTFPSELRLEAYINRDDYGTSKTVPGVYAAVVFEDTGGAYSSSNGGKVGAGQPLGSWSYKIRANASDTPDTHFPRDDYRRGSDSSFITKFLYSSAFSYGTAGDPSNQPYLPLPQPGFLALQGAVDKFILSVEDTSGQQQSLMTNDLLSFAADWGCMNVPALVNPTSKEYQAVSAALRSHSLLPQHVTLVPFPVSEFRSDDFYTFVSNVFAFIFVLSFFFPSFFLIRGVVVEKETRIREGMRMMGLSDSALFVAWYITYGILFLLIALVIAIIAGSTFFSNSDGGLLFLYFTFFGWSAMALCVLLSTFFSRAKLAAAVGAVIFIATFFPYFSVNDRTKSDAAKVAASILSPVSFGLALDVVSQLEANGVGVGWKNLYQPIAAGSNYSFGTALGFLILDFFLYTVLALYLGNVLPQEFGLPMPWYYPCTPRWLRDNLFCCCCGRKNGKLGGEDRHRGVRVEKEGLLSGIAGSLTSGGVVVVPNPAASGSLNSAGTPASHSAGSAAPANWSERFDKIGIATGDAVEPPGPQLRDLASEGRNIAVRSLNKLFPTPDGLKAAVDGVDLDMFEGQIFGLLGHNGAGKTTLISMLTGLIPPTDGDAFIYGKQISTEMQDIRGSLGVCPQHDVLWPDLTVKEHLMFFAGIKGMPQKEIYPAVMSMIREVGLTEKVDTKSAELSGGQKRKLSVGIALIGGSRVVVLDEPTSGMDPYSRRFTWNVIQSNKANRIIVLTTHFLEEADILCDRIAIMGSGKVRCVGSSMYLKGLYGVGYNLTCVKGPGCDSNALEAIVAKHLGHLPPATPAAAMTVAASSNMTGGYHVLSNVGSEMSFQIPFAASSFFPALFRELEQHIVSTEEIEALADSGVASSSSSGSAALAIKSAGSGIVRLATYGVSVTTLEEVFIRVAEEGHYEGKKTAPNTPNGVDVLSPVSTVAADAVTTNNKAGDHFDHSVGGGSSLTNDNVEADSYTRDKSTNAGGITGDGKGLFMRHFRALFCKRWRYALRDRRAMCFQLLIPVAALLLGLALLHQVTTQTWPELPLSLTSYNNPLTASASAAVGTGPGAPAWARQGNPPNFVPVAVDDDIPSSVASALLSAIQTSGAGPTVPPPSPSPSTSPAPNPGGNTPPAAPPAPDTSLFPAAAGATFIEVPMSFLVSQYNYSDYGSYSGNNNGRTAYEACSYPDPNMAVALLNKTELALLEFPFYSLNETWMMSRFLLDSKNGSAPWIKNQAASVAVDGAIAAATEARRLRASSALAPASAAVAASSPAVIPQFGASRYGAIMINEAKTVGANNVPSYASYTALINTTGLFAAPTFVAMVHSGIYNWYATAVSGNPSVSANVSISVTNAPLPFTKLQGTIINSLLSFVAVLFIVVAFSFIPASFAVFIVKETEVKAKHQQLISGVSIPAYWLATYTWDAINYALPCIMAIILVIAFDVSELVGPSLSATVLLFVFYGLSVAPFTYILSYAFKSHSTAQIMTLVVNLLCVILLLASFVMQQVQATCPADTYLRFVYRLLPGYALGNGLIQLSLLKELPFLESNCGTLSILDRIERTYTPFSLEAAGYPLLYMVLESVIYFLVAVGIDVLLSYPVIRSRLIPDKDIPEQPYEEDSDVEAEAARVASGRANQDTIILKHLRKVYKGGKLAVKNLSFGIPKGEVFGFLGINGAGKTTTLKMLSGDEIPTRGTATLGGFDILTQQMEVRRLLGYTPQFDAHLDLLTTREHLEMYARIKGVPESMLDNVVNAKLREMDLVQYANKLAGSLSGGNKRKLSVAIAMVGDPPLMFLDEPSTGVDPVARRFLWRTIARVATERKQTSIILTTHSMEECEALSRRVGIMVGGRLRCLGSTQHLKDKFGRGFLALIKLQAPSEDRINAVMRYMEPFFVFTPAGEPTIQGTSIRELCAALGDPTRARMLHPNGTGWALASVLTREAHVDARQFAEWWASESVGADLNAFILRVFPGSTLSERHGEFFSYRIEISNVDHNVLNVALAGGTGAASSAPASADLLGLGGAATSSSLPVPLAGSGGHAPIRLSVLFSVFEAAKARLGIQEYSLSQTSLEQIFNSMASQQEEEAGPLRGVAGGNSAAPASTSASAAAAAAGGPQDSAGGTSPVSQSSLAGGAAAASGGIGDRKQSFASKVFTSLGNVAATSSSNYVGASNPKRASVGGVEMRPSDASAITAYSHLLDGPQ